MSDFVPSAACCTTPAVIGPPYEPKGAFVQVDGMTIYRTGPSDATKALFILYDVFGYSSQILQGADTLASKGYNIFMPDFFEGKPAPLTWMPMPDAAGKEPVPDDRALTDFCNGPGNTDATVTKALKLQKRLQSMYPQITKWGLAGYCWGGFVSNYLLDANSPFTACGQLHAAWPENEIAVKIARPILALCSKDEPEKEYAHFKPLLKVEAEFVHFPDMVHGWMSARGDLTKPEVVKQFERGYEMLDAFFARHL